MERSRTLFRRVRKFPDQQRRGAADFFIQFAHRVFADADVRHNKSTSLNATSGSVV